MDLSKKAGVPRGMKIEKRFAGEHDWKEVAEAEALSRFADFFIDVTLIQDELDAGHEIRTSFAYYRKAVDPRDA